MDNYSENVVTDMLVRNEIIRRQDSPEVFKSGAKYSANPNYDLTSYLSAPNKKVSKFGSRYKFVGVGG